MTGDAEAGPPPDLRDIRRLDVLGSGASAVVHRAVSDAFGGTFALKVWREPLDEEEHRRFRDECSLHQALSGHPHIVRFLHGEVTTDGQAWTATELCEESLEERLRRVPPVTPQQARVWAGDIVSGLAEIHRHGHVHRDVKPSNVLLREGRALLCDLGIARPVGRHTDHAAAGTSGYLAPELGHGGQPDQRSDVYSAALTLLALLEPHLSPGLENLLVRASSSHPADRPPDAAAFLAQLTERFAASGTEVTPPVVKEPPRRRTSSRAALPLLAGALVLVAALLINGPHHPAARSRTKTGESAPAEPAVSRPGEASGTAPCLDRINVPSEVTTTRFTMSVQIRCPVRPGEEIHLVSMIRGTTPGPVEYWINSKWRIDPASRAVQTYLSTVSKGVTRTYLLIAATPAHLRAVENQPGNLQPDGSGYRSIGDLVPISNQPVNRQIPG